MAALMLPSSSRRYAGTAPVDGKRGCRWGCKHLPTAPELSIQTVGELVWNDMHPVNMTQFGSGALRSPCWTTADGTNRCLPALFVVGLPKCGTTDFAAKIGHAKHFRPDPLLRSVDSVLEVTGGRRAVRKGRTGETHPIPAALSPCSRQLLAIFADVRSADVVIALEGTTRS